MADQNFEIKNFEELLLTKIHFFAGLQREIVLFTGFPDSVNFFRILIRWVILLQCLMLKKCDRIFPPKFSHFIQIIKKALKSISELFWNLQRFSKSYLHVQGWNMDFFHNPPLKEISGLSVTYWKSLVFNHFWHKTISCARLFGCKTFECY